MVDYTTGSGSSGTLIIRDNGSTVEFIIACSNPSTSVGSFVWGGTINGQGLGDRVTNLPAGFGARSLGVWTLTTNQTVEFNFQDTGTSGLGGPTALTAFIQRATTPPPPNNLLADAITTTSMRLRWTVTGDGGSGLTQLQLQRATNSNFTQDVITTYSGSGTVMTGLSPNKLYYWRVRAVNSIGAGGWSGVISARTAAAVPGTPPAPIVTLRTGRLISVNITDPVNNGSTLEERQVQISKTSTFTTVVSTTGQDDPTFNDLERATDYFVRNRARNQAGWGPWSPTVATETLVDRPTAPRGYTVTDIASTTAYLSVGPVQDNGGAPLTNYRVQVNTVQSDVGGLFFTVGAVRPAQLFSLVPGTLYYARAAALNSGGGWGPYGVWVAFTTKSNTPTPPRSLTATNVTETTADISWIEPLDLHGATILAYTLRAASDPAFAISRQTISIDPDLLAWTLDGLQPGTTYYVHLWTDALEGLGSYTRPIEFTTEGTAPAPATLWMRIDGVHTPGVMWGKIPSGLSAFPGERPPANPDAFPSYSGAKWRKLISWMKVGLNWRTGK